VHFARAAVAPLPNGAPHPLGGSFDTGLWTAQVAAPPADPKIAALVTLAQAEFAAGRHFGAAAVARLTRSVAPHETEPLRLLSLVAGGPQDGSADYFYALGQAHRILGQNEEAVQCYRHALGYYPDYVMAHVHLSELRMPGESYLSWVGRLYDFLAPETVIEIGVFQGASIAQVKPPTLAIGIDPTPAIHQPLAAETHIFPENSDAFFARKGPDALLAGRKLGVGFIDGLHHFEQVLRDFINLEKYAGPNSVILLHDTVPLDEPTQRRERETHFFTGDVWKIVPCLKHYRPDLDIFTIATAPTGLTVVSKLDPHSRVLAEHYDEAVKRFIDMPFANIEPGMDAAFNIVANDWETVRARLRPH